MGEGQRDSFILRLSTLAFSLTKITKQRNTCFIIFYTFYFILLHFTKVAFTNTPAIFLLHLKVNHKHLPPSWNSRPFESETTAECTVCTVSFHRLSFYTCVYMYRVSLNLPGLPTPLSLLSIRMFISQHLCLYFCFATIIYTMCLDSTDMC